MKILILNGSPQGRSGNCAHLAEHIVQTFSEQIEFKILHLSDELKSDDLDQVLQMMRESDAHLYLTGTYWDSWGSPLQQFLERSTPFEGQDVFLGKPAGVFVLMHSVGGKGICSRLQGVLNTLGYLIPPMSGWVYSLVSQLAAAGECSDHDSDFWSFEDLSPILNNVVRYSKIGVQPVAWAFDKKDAKRRWISMSSDQ